MQKRWITCTVVLGSAGWIGHASSSTFQALPLAKLVAQSELVVVATPISQKCQWAKIGSLERVVTDSTLEVAWTLSGSDSTGRDVVVRTLGGTIGDLAQIVHGEARLRVGQSSLLFLARGRDGALHVFGMGQGHYPLIPDDQGDWQVRPSPGLEGVLDPHNSARYSLVGKRLKELPQIIANARAVP
jgi:hypothetical protein